MNLVYNLATPLIPLLSRMTLNQRQSKIQVGLNNLVLDAGTLAHANNGASEGLTTRHGSKEPFFGGRRGLGDSSINEGLFPWFPFDSTDACLFPRKEM